MEILSFKSSSEFRAWLEKNHRNSDGIWLQIFKKGSNTEAVSYSEALDQALCFGWIDGLKKPCDSRSWLQKFTPRRPRSGWSKKNTDHAERLIKTKEMTPWGLAEIEAAKADGRWGAAYDSQKSSSVPEDFIVALSSNPKALQFFESLDKANLYSIAYRLQTAKTEESRDRRMKMILEMMAEGKKFHP